LTDYAALLASTRCTVAACQPPRPLGLGMPRAVKATAIAASEVAPSALMDEMTDAMSVA
jgi:hypothetical protein